jgi:hypothetical protein
MSRDCPKGSFVIEKIKEFSAVLANVKLPLKRRKIALKIWYILSAICISLYTWAIVKIEVAGKSAFIICGMMGWLIGIKKHVEK